VSKLIEVRGTLECKIARLAAKSREDTHLEAMRQNISEMEENYEDLDYCVTKDMEFHGILREASGNRIFEVVLGPLSEILWEIRRGTTQLVGVGIGIGGHKQLLQAVEAKDPEQAEKAMHDHIYCGWLDVLKNEGQSPQKEDK